MEISTAVSRRLALVAMSAVCALAGSAVSASAAPAGFSWKSPAPGGQPGHARLVTARAQTTREIQAHAPTGPPAALPAAPRSASRPAPARGPRSGGAFAQAPAPAFAAATAQTAGTQFLGAQPADSSTVPPDSMGTVGPSQFVVAVNGRIRSFNKTTGAADGVLNVDTGTFFAFGSGGLQVSDPQVRYDRLTGRWFISIISVPQDPNPANRWMVRVSDTSVLTAGTSWSGAVFNWSAASGNSGCVIDYDSLGIDAEALEAGVNVLCGSSMATLQTVGTEGMVFPKAGLLSGTPTVTEFHLAFGSGTSCSDGPWSPRGVDSVDPAATTGYFAGISWCSFNELAFAAIANPGSASPSGSLHRLVVAKESFPQPIAAMGSTHPLDSLDDRLFAAVLRNGHLWTAHNICVDATGLATSPQGGPCPAGARVASRWYDITAIGGTPALNQSGTVFDSSATNPANYFIPSIMVSGQGHAAMGMSVAGAAEHAEAAFAGRLAGDAAGTMSTPTVYQASTFTYNAESNPTGGVQRWGDYSFTSLDPSDDMTMWTIQEFANATDSWGVEAVRLLAPPPATPASYTGNALANQCAQQLMVTGTSTSGSGFFDPGPGFTNHITATVSGGVTVNTVKYVDATHLVLDIGTQGATTGLKDLTITNPDGQQVTVTGFINVLPASATAMGTDSRVSGLQYTLSNSDGGTWQEIDPALRISCTPTADQSTLLSANADLWTSNAGYNQDIGIFVSDNGGADQLLAWKESGGFAGTFSPNAAYAQALFTMTAAGGHTYVFKLKWKANKNAPGATIWAGAGPIGGQFSPTSLVAKFYPSGTAPSAARSTAQYMLTGSDGATWQPVDQAVPANLTATVNPAADVTAVLNANADLFTSNAGYNQDLGILVKVDSGAFTAQPIAWKESGGFAGTFSPNAAFLKAEYAMTGGHTYQFELAWKANKNAPGATIWAGAGPINGTFSPTSLIVDTEPTAALGMSSAVTTQETQTNSGGVNWTEMDPALRVTFTATSDGDSIVGANADLFTSVGGYNQDIAIFVSDNGGADQLVAWKESGGFAGTFSPNAAFAQANFLLVSGHTYTFKLKWKTNKPSGTTIWAGAGPISGLYSPTRLSVELTS